ncbi:MAG TPA: hypothetical protein VJ825_09080 [Gemmatimonadaceae bacterium]|nr:hypothetical protein [Gemmatimonadaceae bacterium]
MLVACIVACKAEPATQAARASDSAVASVSSSPIAAPNTPRTPTNMRLVVDSQATGANLQANSTEYVVRLSPAMGQVLFDSLPGFIPFAPTTYPAKIHNWVALSDTAAKPLSVVIGDFDADSIPDAAMIGDSRDSLAMVMVISNKKGGAKPRLLLFFRPQAYNPAYAHYDYLSPKKPGRLSPDFVLRADGVEYVVYDKTSSVYYLDNGVLRKFTESEE